MLMLSLGCLVLTVLRYVVRFVIACTCTILAPHVTVVANKPQAGLLLMKLCNPLVLG